MNKSQLYIDNVPVPVMEELQVNISKLIADVRDPDKRNTDFSNTVLIPGTNQIDKLFEFCFELDIDLQYFNPNLKTAVSYKVNNTEVIGGWLKLSKIRRNYDKKYHIYECEIKGHFSDLFFKMADLELRSLDFSEYDHDLTRDNVTDSSNASPTNYVNGSLVAAVEGLGYRYPVIDFGYNNGNVTEFKLAGFRPIFFAYEYLLKIFATHGKTFSSNFLSSSYFKKVAILPTEIIKKDSDVIDNTTFIAGQTGIDLNYQFALTSSGTPTNFYWNNPASYQSTIILNNDSTLPYRDASGMNDTTTGIFTIAATSIQTVKLYLHIIGKVNTPSPTDTVGERDLFCQLHLDTLIGGVWTLRQSSDPVSFTANTADMNHVFSFEFTGLFTAGETNRIRMDSSMTKVRIFDSGGFPVVAGTATYSFVITKYGIDASTDPYLTISPTSMEVDEGELVQVNQAIPDKIKQADFFKGIINMFNLYCDIDKDDPNNYIIEPEPFFFQDAIYARDWSDKIDIGQDVVIEPVAGGAIKGMKLLYKSDGDYYNKVYQDQYGEPYGTLITQGENQFNKEIKTIELLFSPTPLVGNDTNKLVIPKIYKNDNGVVKPTRANIRIGFWNPVPVNIYPSNWVIKSTIYGDLSNTEYPYCGHLDHPFFPTIDMNFDVPFEIYYTLQTGQTYTTSNLWTYYYKTLFERLTDKNSKRVTAQFALNELDLKVFDFRQLVYVLGTYMRVNAINNFNILENKTTEVELLKI